MQLCSYNFWKAVIRSKMNKYTMIMQSNQCTDYENINYSIDVIAKE